MKKWIWESGGVCDIQYPGSIWVCYESAWASLISWFSRNRPRCFCMTCIPCDMIEFSTQGKKGFQGNYQCFTSPRWKTFKSVRQGARGGAGSHPTSLEKSRSRCSPGRSHRRQPRSREAKAQRWTASVVQNVAPRVARCCPRCASSDTTWRWSRTGAWTPWNRTRDRFARWRWRSLCGIVVCGISAAVALYFPAPSSSLL